MKIGDKIPANKVRIIFVTLFILIVMFFISLFTGRYNITPSNLLVMIYKSFTGGQKLAGNDWSVFYYIRLPRVLLVMAVGAGLSLTGATYQSLFRNPLVSPSILGVSAGAGFGVALGLFLNCSIILVYFLAFLSGIFAVLSAFFISSWSKGKDAMVLVLAGIVVTSLFNALLSLLKYLADPYEELPGIVFWLMGGFSRTGWQEVKLSLPFIILGITVIIFLRWQLNVISMGEEEAVSLGINTSLLRVVLVVVSTFIISSTVAVAGQITWIGLIIPHIARYLVGADHRYILPVTGLTGGALLLLMDNLARTMTSAEIPISIITAFIGAPFFAYLLITKRESGWG